MLSQYCSTDIVQYWNKYKSIYSIFPYSTVFSLENEPNLRVRNVRHQIIFQQITTKL